MKDTKYETTPIRKPRKRHYTTLEKVLRWAKSQARKLNKGKK